jgi:hypothetical protein
MTIIRKARRLRYLPFLPPFLYVRAGGQEARQARQAEVLERDDGDGEWVIPNAYILNNPPAMSTHCAKKVTTTTTALQHCCPSHPYIHTYEPDLHLMKGTERKGTAQNGTEHDYCFLTLLPPFLRRSSHRSSSSLLCVVTSPTAASMS